MEDKNVDHTNKYESDDEEESKSIESPIHDEMWGPRSRSPSSDPARSRKRIRATVAIWTEEQDQTLVQNYKKFTVLKPGKEIESGQHKMVQSSKWYSIVKACASNEIDGVQIHDIQSCRYRMRTLKERHRKFPHLYCDIVID